MGRMWAAWLGLAASIVAAAPAALEGRVLRVVDGDSLWIEPVDGGAPLELRLEGIDAPEICQAWGPEAKAALQELVARQPVQVRLGGRDVHGRQLGTVFVGPQNVNRLLVQEGHAWSSRYKYDRGPYVADERMARALNRGFNREGGAVMPSEFRRQHGPCNDAAAAPAPAAPRPAPGVAAASPAWRCDGRLYCSQMKSCAEATWFLKNCPGVKMDGDGNGVPCERQWCRP